MGLEAANELSEANVGVPVKVIGWPPGNPEVIPVELPPSSHGQYATTFGTAFVSVNARYKSDSAGGVPCRRRRSIPAAEMSTYTSVPEMSVLVGHAVTSPWNRYRRTPFCNRDTRIGVFRPILPKYGPVGFLGLNRPSRLFNVIVHVCGCT
jgi:hypothetical protein